MGFMPINLPPMMPMTQQTFSSSVQNSSDGQPTGWTQSVTYVYGQGGGQQPQVQSFTMGPNGQAVPLGGINVNNTNNVQVNFGDPNQAAGLNPMSIFQDLINNMVGAATGPV